MSKSKEEQKIIDQVMKLKSEIIKNVGSAIMSSLKGKSLDGYKIVWNQLQEITIPEIEKIIKKNFSGCVIEVTNSKSTYPDLKMTYKDYDFAFDIKSNESSKEPWYDIARLDSIEKERLNKYSEEFDVVIKYDSQSGKLLDVYFEILRQTVGYNDKSKGVKFRPYDGKLRPKSWNDFAKGKIYWHSHEDFLKGIRNSQIYRWKLLIKDILLKLLSKEEKEEFKKLFE